MKTFKQFKAQLNESAQGKFDPSSLVRDLSDPNSDIYPEEAYAKKSGRVKAVARTNTTVRSRNGVIPKVTTFNITKFGTVLVKAGDPVVFDEDGDGPLGGKVYGYSEAEDIYYAVDFNTFVKTIGFK